MFKFLRSSKNKRPQQSSAPAVTPSNLCNDCTEWLEAAWSKANPSTGYVREWLPERAKESFQGIQDCPLCCSVTTAVAAIVDGADSTLIRNPAVVSALAMKDSRPTARQNTHITAKKSRHTTAEQDSPDPILKLEVRYGGREAGVFQFHTTTRSHKLLEDTVSTELVKKWLYDCTSGNDVHRQLSETGHSDSIPIILIDVLQGRLAAASTKEKYVALSYRWGDVQTFKTYRGNYTQLCEVGSLSPDDARIPHTIRDALSFTKSIGERFLWVDALSIIQDDSQQKHDQIRAMNLIYSNAALTLIACTGDNANAGLPGTRKSNRLRRSRPETVILNTPEPVRATLVTRSPELHWILKRSSYETRGWTYQERVLSPRCLFFTEWQVFFQCQHASYREDGDRMSTIELSPFIELMTDRSTEGRLWDIYRAYIWLAQTYTERHLSQASDILDAFRGIASELQRRTEHSLLAGMLVPFFDLLLCWIPRGSSRSQRRLSRAGSAEYFPSWSWVGWTGQAFLPQLIQSNRYKPLIDEIGIGHPTPWKTLTRYDGLHWRPKTDLSETQSNFSVDSNTLRFSTASIPALLLSFDVAASPGTDVRSLLVFEKRPHTNSIGETGEKKPCGVLRFHSKEDVEARAKVQCRGDHLIGLITMDDALYSVDSFGLPDKPNNGYVDVMLIDKVRSAAERIAVGIIMADVWGSFNPQKEDILLK